MRPATLNLGLVVAAHFVLGVVAAVVPVVATLHAVITLVLALGTALVGRRLERVAYMTAYVAGAEVFWRMSRIPIFWETGKYAVIFVLGVALIRFFERWRDKALPITYFCLLLPSIALTVDALGATNQAREEISFNLAGPLSIAVCVLFFSQVQASGLELRRIAWMTLAPIVSIATVALFGTVTTADIEFTSESSFVTSGGFGPNQVSAALGLGLMLAVLLAVTERHFSARWLAIGLGLWFGAQSLLTLSRGGIFNAAVAVGLASIFYVRDPGRRAAWAGAVLATLLLGVYFVVPRLNSFTGGVLEERFTDPEPTHRTELVKGDLDVWREHFAWGVGPGMAKEYRGEEEFLQGADHTEFTRLVAEHGLPGLAALALLLLITARAYVRARIPARKAWVVAMAGWSFAQMAHSATRIVALSLLFGLMVLRWRETERPAPEPEHVHESRLAVFAERHSAAEQPG